MNKFLRRHKQHTHELLPAKSSTVDGAKVQRFLNAFCSCFMEYKFRFRVLFIVQRFSTSLHIINVNHKTLNCSMIVGEKKREREEIECVVDERSKWLLKLDD